MKARAKLVTIWVSVALLLPQSLFGTLIRPTFDFSFASPVLDRAELVELLQAGLRPLGFVAGPITNVRPNGYFRVTYTSTDSGEVFLDGPLSCVTVTIYTSYEDEPGEDAIKKAQEIQDVILAQLHAVAGEDVLTFQAIFNEPCTQAL